MNFFEANFDGLVGPTHNYAGLSFGNLASSVNAKQNSNPKNAVKQGLNKAKALADMGLIQGILPPQERPNISILKQLGFYGSDAEILADVANNHPKLLTACASASSMWTANAATISSSFESSTGKIHITPANLLNKFHRSLEAPTTSRILKAVFQNEKYFSHHQPLPMHNKFSDEGAANHTRMYQSHNNQGIEVYVYGENSADPSAVKPKKYPPRQTLTASQAITRLHQVKSQKTVFIQQNPDVIDQGVFHNDVIAVGNQNVLFYHQDAFVDTQAKLTEIQYKLGGNIHFIEVSKTAISVKEAISTYLFNSQLVTLNDGSMALIAPNNCQENPRVFNYLQQITSLNTPIKKVHYFDVKQSMANGGGPACLRLRVPLNPQELAAINPACLLNDTLYNGLNLWIDKHYRDRLSIKDLADPQLLNECRCALDELTQIMQLGSIYQFQQ